MDAALKCTFPGCAKTTSFKTEKLLMTHVENIHTFPLYCTQPGCPYRRPFPRKGDLDRHLASKHGIGRLFRCPRLDCPRHRRPYGRKDKLRDHVNDYAHGINHCQYDHCLLKSERGLFCQTDVTKHEQSSKHGEYECSIGDCAGSNSHFTKQGLSFHLSSHRIGPREVDIEKMLKPGKHVLRSEDINQLVYSDKTKATSCVDAYQSKSCTA
ncbi:uncharacterized protein LY89DRAFT_406326 [Mollisia scopiformis]|uniref:C2H2-type domain-containing protein n=1 Tax=Mollisia scopiformis TaxID=149040 RepID=A0A132B2H4_MOLSC|nr:uncharacterized protein LY89DRAFT_406326 [Mollisia scopiformis]KUJ06586.1 hypothetical protein LY89DRAFT_406326 [Mollisia scopiformis]